MGFCFSGMDCLMVLIRYLNYHLPKEEIFADHPSRQAEEFSNPFMRLAWKTAPLQTDGDHRQLALELKERAMVKKNCGRAFSPRELVAETESYPPYFLGILITLPLSLSIFLEPSSKCAIGFGGSNESWLRVLPKAEHRSIDRDSGIRDNGCDYVVSALLSAVPHFVQTDGNNASQYQKIPQAPAEMAKAQIITINNEESNAARAIEEICGFKYWENGMGYDYVDGDVPGHFKFEFTPSAADDVSLESLLSFTVTLPSDGGEPRYYVLLAAVRERARAKEPDCICLFTTDGRDLFTNEEEDYSNTEWAVGAPGYTYNMYYGQTLEIFDSPPARSRARIRRQTLVAAAGLVVNGV
ncbi:hypothetical protein CSOJ01_07392 [Colletotrichum sojae]|uniref:Uncharacterized protein n=1 Tax=Colletotrichum sojae TaxID=2175907 RepID=A0A8H6J928_9PEZI|nr:hypothetical protein CSOJ01_07392 [Colletotrichum sojae]